MSVDIFKLNPNSDEDSVYLLCIIIFQILYWCFKIFIFPVLFKFKNKLPHIHNFLKHFGQDNKFRIKIFLLVVLLDLISNVTYDICTKQPIFTSNIFTNITIGGATINSYICFFIWFIFKNTDKRYHINTTNLITRPQIQEILFFVLVNILLFLPPLTHTTISMIIEQIFLKMCNYNIFENKSTIILIIQFIYWVYQISILTILYNCKKTFPHISYFLTLFATNKSVRKSFFIFILSLNLLVNIFTCDTFNVAFFLMEFILKFVFTGLGMFFPYLTFWLWFGVKNLKNK